MKKVSSGQLLLLDPDHGCVTMFSRPISEHPYGRQSFTRTSIVEVTREWSILVIERLPDSEGETAVLATSPAGRAQLGWIETEELKAKTVRAERISERIRVGVRDIYS